MAAKPPASWHPPERLEREAKAIAAVRGGEMTLRGASRTYGIPAGTLSDRLQWFGQGEREDRMREAEEQILELTMTTAEAAQRELARRVTEDPGSLTVKELVPIAGMSQDKLALRRNWGKGGPGEGVGVGVLAEALQQLAAGGRLTIEGPRPGDQAIDVTPEEAGE